MSFPRSFRDTLLIAFVTVIVATAASRDTQAASPFTYAVTASDDPVQPGQSVTFIVTVTNNTAAGATADVDYTVPTYTTVNGTAAGVQKSFELYDVAANSSVTQAVVVAIDTTTNVTTAPPDGKPITLTFNETNYGGTFSRTVVAHNTPVLDLQLASTQATVTPGTAFTYALSYRSTAAVAGVTLSVPVPANATFVSADGGGAPDSNNVVQWSLGALPAGASGQVHLILAASSTVSTVGQVALEASLGDGAGDAAHASAVTLIDVVPTFTYAVTASDDPVQPGQSVTFIVTVTNNTAAGATADVDYTVPTSTTVNGTAAGVQKSFELYDVAANSSVTQAVVVAIDTITNVTTAPPDGTPITLTFNEADYGGTFSRTVTVRLPPVIADATASTAKQGQPFSSQIIATNFPTSYNATGLPAGLSINSVTGLISGTPTVAGTFPVGLSATNPGGTGTGALTLIVNPAPPVITSIATASGTQGRSFSYLIAASYNPTSYGASGLPAGLAVNASSGVISGTPTVSGIFPVALSAANAGGSGTQTLTLNIAAAPPTITSILSASGAQDQPFSYQITASNSPTQFSAAGLPSGLIINIADGFISGTPTVAGTFLVTLSAANIAGTTDATLFLSITALPTAPVIGTMTASATQGHPFTLQISATGNPTSYGASGLPEGLSINSTSGFISGTPITYGLFRISVSATNSGGTGTGVVTLAIARELPTVIISDTISEVKVGTDKVGLVTIALSAVQKEPVLVHYAIRGSAVNGKDYVLLTGTKRIRAGTKKQSIKIIPRGDLDGAERKVVTLVLKPGPGYIVGHEIRAKVTLLGANG
jgi:hypothetical protein